MSEKNIFKVEQNAVFSYINRNNRHIFKIDFFKTSSRFYCQFFNYVTATTAFFTACKESVSLCNFNSIVFRFVLNIQGKHSERGIK